MVRRTKVEALATREALLDAAERMFRESGVTRTTLGDVAAAAGVTRGAIYWHFRDKDELFGAMCSRATLPLQTALEQAACAENDDALATLHAVGVSGLREIATNPRTRAVLEILLHKSERCGEPIPGAQRPDESGRKCVDALTRIVRRAVTQGRLPADTDPRIAGIAVQAYFTGILDLWLTDSESFDLAALASGLIGTLVAGLEASPPRLSGRAAAADPALALHAG